MNLFTPILVSISLSTPLPTISEADSVTGPFLSFTSSSAFGFRFGSTYRDPLGEHHWSSTGRSGSRRIVSATSDDESRTTIFKRIQGAIEETAMVVEFWPQESSFKSLGWTEVDRFIRNSVAIRAEFSGARRLQVEIQVFPLEGLSFMMGFDSGHFELFSGLQIGF